MATITLIIAILLANQVMPAQINITTLYPTKVNTLPTEHPAKGVFASQILQFQATSEATPAASAGNNLNVFASNGSLHEQDVNFQAISTFHSFENKTANGSGHNEEKIKSTLLSATSVEDFPKEEKISVNKNSEPLSLVWDSCLETKSRDQIKSNIEIQNGMDISKSDVQNQIDKNDNYSWIKRNVNNTAAYKVWLEKYNNLMYKKMEQRRQQKQDYVLIKKGTIALSTVTPEINLSYSVEVIPITREVFRISTETVNLSQEIVTENTVRSGYTGDWIEAKDKTKIRFSGLPQTENYLIPALKLEEGFYPFGFMSDFFSVIYPFEFPVGLLKDIVWGKFEFPHSFLKSIKVESTFLGFIIVFACIAMVIPVYLIILGILSLMSNSRSEDEMETGALFPDDDSEANDRVVAIITLFVILMCCLLICGMVITNEQAHAAAVGSRNVLSCACADVAAWLAAAARELHHSLVPPVDLVLHAFREDLNNVEILLGEPIQQAIAAESGIELVLESLADIIAESEKLSTKISSLWDISRRAGALASSTSEKIKELARQLDSLKKYCTVKDMPLCDTINTNSLELQMKFDSILHEQQLLELRTLGVKNLTVAISTARQDFKSLPTIISSQTAQSRADILKDIEVRRQEVDTSSRVFSDIVRHVTSSLHVAVRQMESSLQRFRRYEMWRWSVMLGCMVTFAFVIFLILMGMLFGCGAAKLHGKRTLQVSAAWLCFTSFILWTLVSIIFLISGHAEIYVCQALWDSPQYKTLSSLLDKPSPLFLNQEGAFDVLFKELENVTIDVSVGNVLRECEQDRPAYVVFQLDKVLDVNKETSYFEWDELQTDLRKLTSSIDVGFLKTVSGDFNTLLEEILYVSDVNLAKYRMDYNGPIVGKDLPALVDQLENIAAQVTDLNTAGRLETLATRTQRLYVSNVKPLEQLKADVVFKLTELELQLMPFRKKLNISLSHIHTSQFYIDNQGDAIAHKKASTFASRLISHTAGWRTHVLTSTGTQAARCKPLFNVFAALRGLFCTRYVSSLHGWWFCGFLLGVCWCAVLLPLMAKLWQMYGRRHRANEALTLTNLGSGQNETPTTAMCESSNWSVPGPPPPPRSDSW